jgi:hypothetical protein
MKMRRVTFSERIRFHLEEHKIRGKILIRHTLDLEARQGTGVANGFLQPRSMKCKSKRERNGENVKTGWILLEELVALLWSLQNNWNEFLVV